MYRTRKMCVVSCRMSCHIDDITDYYDTFTFNSYDEAKEWCKDEFKHKSEDQIFAGVIKYLYEDEDVDRVYIDYEAINCDTNTIAYSKRIYYY